MSNLVKRYEILTNRLKENYSNVEQSELCDNVIINDDIAILEFVGELRNELDSDKMLLSIKFGSLNCLKFINSIIRNKINEKFEIECLNCAVKYNQFECFRYMLENNFWYDYETYNTIVEFNRLRFLQFLHQNYEIRWNQSTGELAIKLNRTEIIDYFLQSKCKYYTPISIYNWLFSIKTEKKLYMYCPHEEQYEPLDYIDILILITLTSSLNNN